MKPKILLTVAGVLFLGMGVTGFFMTGDYDYFAYNGGVFALALGVLFLLARNAPASKTLDAILITGFLAGLGMGLNALYGQWSGNYMDTAVGYIPGLVWLGLAVWFFLVWRGNRSAA